MEKNERIKARIRDIMSEGRKEKGIKRAVIVLSAVIVVSVTVAFLLYASVSAGRIAEVETKTQELERENWALKEDLEMQKKIRLYAEKLPLKDVAIKNMSGELTVSGKISNRGPREVNDVELTVYLMDGDGNPVYQSAHNISSYDGLPLKQYQQRKFRIEVNLVPETAEDVMVLITNITFQS